MYKRMIIELISGVCHNMGVSMAAEGSETEEL